MPSGFVESEPSEHALLVAGNALSGPAQSQPRPGRASIETREGSSREESSSGSAPSGQEAAGSNSLAARLYNQPLFGGYNAQADAQAPDTQEAPEESGGDNGDLSLCLAVRYVVA